MFRESTCILTVPAPDGAAVKVSETRAYCTWTRLRRQVSIIEVLLRYSLLIYIYIPFFPSFLRFLFAICEGTVQIIKTEYADGLGTAALCRIFGDTLED